MDAEECERLHAKHGSTLEGLKREHGIYPPDPNPQIRFTVDMEECERLHNKYGSTLEGLKVEHGMDAKSERSYYREVFAAVCPLHPTPYTLHPTPYTLHPTPYTLHPTLRSHSGVWLAENLVTGLSTMSLSDASKGGGAKDTECTASQNILLLLFFITLKPRVE